MDKTQRSKLNMFTAVVLYFNYYADLIKDFAQLIKEVAAFSTIVTEMGVDIGQQKKDTRGITASKNILVNDAIKQVVKVSRKARVWAENTGDVDLEQIFNIHVTDFAGLGDAVIVEQLTVVVNIINENLTKMIGYKLEAANMLVVAAAMTAARGSLGTTTQASSVKVNSTHNIEAKLAEGMNQLIKIDDLFVPEFEDTNPDEVGEYHQNRIINPIGTHHTGLAATVTNAAKSALFGVKCNIAEINRSALSNHDGLIEMSKFKAGKYELVFSLLGYNDYTLVVDFPSGKTITIDIVMKPFVP